MTEACPVVITVDRIIRGTGSIRENVTSVGLRLRIITVTPVTYTGSSRVIQVLIPHHIDQKIKNRSMLKNGFLMIDIKEIASGIQRLLISLKTGHLYRRTVQLLQALQIFNAGNAIR